MYCIYDKDRGSFLGEYSEKGEFILVVFPSFEDAQKYAEKEWLGNYEILEAKPGEKS